MRLIFENPEKCDLSVCINPAWIVSCLWNTLKLSSFPLTYSSPINWHREQKFCNKCFAIVFSCWGVNPSEPPHIVWHCNKSEWPCNCWFPMPCTFVWMHLITHSIHLHPLSQCPTKCCVFSLSIQNSIAIPHCSQQINYCRQLQRQGKVGTIDASRWWLAGLYCGIPCVCHLASAPGLEIKPRGQFLEDQTPMTNSGQTGSLFGWMCHKGHH